MIRGIKFFKMGILAITKATVMAENTETENAYYKGANFEILFAEFMKSDLGWDGYAIRSQQKGKANSKGAQVDIIGKRKDDKGRKLYNLFLIFLIIAFGLIIISLVLYTDNYLELMQYSALLSIVFALGALFSFLYGRNFYQENAWVECKNRKGKATYEQVQKSIHEYKDYIDSGDKEYKFITRYFVSATGFVDNALKLALDNNIECYEYIEGRFEKVTYWK